MIVNPGQEVDITGGSPFFLDPASAGDVTIYATITDPSKSGSGSTYIPCQMKTLQNYNSHKNVIINGGSTFNYTMTIDGIPCTYNHGDIQIQYTVADTGDLSNNFDLTWDCNASCSYPTTFTNTSLITDGTWVESDNSDVDMSNVTAGTTLIQRFYMKAYPSPQPDNGSGLFPATTLSFSIKNNLAGFASFSNIVTKAAIFYYSDFASQDNSSSYFEITDTGIINVGVSGYSSVTNVIAHVLTVQQYLSVKTGKFEDVVLPFKVALKNIGSSIWSSEVRVLYATDINYYKAHKTDPYYYAEIIGTSLSNTTSSLSSSKYKLNYTIDWNNAFVMDSFECHIQPVGISITELFEYVTGVKLFGIEKQFTQNLLYPSWYTAEWSSTSLSALAITQIQEAGNSWGSKYCSLVFKDSSGSSTGEDAEKLVYIKINNYDEWIPVMDGKDITFSQDFEFATGTVVASNDIFNFGYKKLNTILVKSDKKYDVSLKVSHNVYKGVYTDLTDEMESQYNK